MMIHLIIEYQKTGNVVFDLAMAMNGSLGGLVAITAGCGTVEFWAAVVIGALAGAIYIGGSKLLIRLRIDDAVDGIPVHMFNGMWGLLSTGLFSAPDPTLVAYGQTEHYGLVYNWDDPALLINQLLAMLAIIFWSAATMGPFFIWLSYMGWLRTDGMEEVVGLDIRYHGLSPEADDEVQEDIRKFQFEQLKMRKLDVIPDEEDDDFASESFQSED